MKIYNKTKQYIMQSDFLKSVSVLFSGNLIANIISFASIPIISRIYNQEAFGEYAVMTSLASIVITVVSLGLTSAIMAPKDEEESKEILSIVAFAEFLLISLFCILLLGLSSFFCIYDVTLKYSYSLLLFGAYSVVYGLFYLLSVITNKKKLNRVLFWNALINATALFVLAIPLGLLGFKSDGLLIAAILSYCAADVQMIVKTRPFVIPFSLERVWHLCRKYKDFILFQFPSNLAGTFAQQYPNQFFSKQYGNASLGGYAMCERILGVPMRLIGAPINTVYFRHASIYVKEEKDLSYFTFRLITVLLAISFIPILVLFIFSEPLFCFILGDGWKEVGKIVSILIIPYFLSFCNTCISYCLVVIDKQRVNLMLTISQLVLIMSALLLGSSLLGSFMYVLEAYAWALIIYNVIHLLTIFYYLRKHYYSFCGVIFLYLFIIYILKFIIIGTV